MRYLTKMGHYTNTNGSISARNAAQVEVRSSNVFRLLANEKPALLTRSNLQSNLSTQGHTLFWIYF